MLFRIIPVGSIPTGSIPDENLVCRALAKYTTSKRRDQKTKFPTGMVSAGTEPVGMILHNIK